MNFRDKLITVLESKKEKHRWSSLDREEVLGIAKISGVKLVHNQNGLYDDDTYGQVDGWMIFLEDDVYWKVRFEEDSMSGGYFTGDIRIVNPTTKTITVWE